MLRPGVVVCYTNAVGFRSFGIIVSEVNGTLEVAYPSWKRLRVVIEPLANPATRPPRPTTSRWYIEPCSDSMPEPGGTTM